MEWIAEIAKEYGLFVALVVYVIWDTRQREQRYIGIIDSLSANYTEIKSDVRDIREHLEKEERRAR